MNSKRTPWLLVLCFIPALCYFFLHSFGDISSDHAMFYFNTYSMGWGGRKLLGTLFNLFYPGDVSRGAILSFVYTVNFIAIFFLILIVSQCLKADCRRAGTLAVIFGLYLMSPYSFVKYIGAGWTLHFIDIYLIALTLVCVWLFMHYRDKWFFYPLLLLLTFSACLIHHLFCSTLLPMLIALFLYDILSDRQKTVRKMMSYGTILMVLFVVFVCIYKYSRMTVDIDTFYNNMVARCPSNLVHHDKDYAVYMQFYASNKSNIDWGKYYMHDRHVETVFTLLFMLPLLVVLWMPWLMSIKHASSLSQRLKYVVVLGASVCFAYPGFVAVTDYGRLFYIFFLCQALLVLLVCFLKDELFCVQIDRMAKWGRDHIIVVVVLGVYLAAFSASDWNRMPLVELIMQTFGLYEAL